MSSIAGQHPLAIATRPCPLVGVGPQPRDPFGRHDREVDGKLSDGRGLRCVPIEGVRFAAELTGVARICAVIGERS